MAADTPGLRWRADLTAGLCVAGLLLPEGVAYAGLAGLPVAHAFAAALVGLAVYALFGRSRDAIVAPTSSSASLAAAAAAGLAGIAPAEALLALTLAAGGVLLALAAARQGQLSAFVSRPVLRGFAFALAITIVIKQLPDVLGLHPPPGLDAPHLLVWVLAHTAGWHGLSLLVALAAGGLIALLRRWPTWPASLIALVAAIAATRWLGLQAEGVEVVGTVAPPAFALHLPDLERDAWLRVAELAVGLVVLLFAESWGSIRALGLQRGDAPDANRELMALGAANVAAGLLQGMPVGAGFSASAANHSAGAQSRRAGLIACAVLGLAIAVALPALQWLPRPVLAVAVIAALWHALSPRPLLATWRLGRDRLLIAGAVVAVLALGLLHGMLASVALSIVEALRRFSQPVLHELGAMPGTRNFVNRPEHPDAVPVPGALILRPQEPLFFASAERVMAEAAARLAASGAATLVMSLEESGDLDSTALECLLELDQRLAARQQRLLLARVKEPVRALLHASAPDGLGREDRQFWSVADAATSLGG
ncbi:SulP family inorganic anion transporter [Roseateles saccharophilus]|uniref:MFS superfamily sulfate permease-like transporter n=1 Tax=Roseateles saccharophilus TaxID=304 RepID=A0A4R3UII6_ROSSA|nr:SulP family inorganic anion transporter [Roseateles saccharophilus]MDG0834427.1 SulP family inorganic anion transporter [Roseateles saccharophilus]TCU89861.1 MFS superfamily sulfate permease-like transporter [Roseateles saccharophilus]